MDLEVLRSIRRGGTIAVGARGWRQMVLGMWFAVDAIEPGLVLSAEMPAQGSRLGQEPVAPGLPNLQALPDATADRPGLS